MLVEFSKSTKSLDGRSSWCLLCSAEVATERRRNDPTIRVRQGNRYQAKRTEILAKTKRSREDRKMDFITRLGGKCFDCPTAPGGEWPVAVFDFHHPNHVTKDRDVAKLMSMKDEILAWAEAQKCVVLCSNCHRRRHAREVS